jgi:ComF family protein
VSFQHFPKWNLRVLFQQALYYLREYFFPIGCGVCGEALQGTEDALYGLCEKCRIRITEAPEFERRCNLCGKPLISEQETCLSCRERVKARSHPESVEKGRYPESTSVYPEATFTYPKSTLGYNETLARIYVLFPYAGMYRSVLAAYKFNKSLGVGVFLARCLSFALGSFDSDVLKEAAWVPVPPRPGKIKNQGWDQIEFLSKQLERFPIDPGPKLPVRGRALRVCRCLKRLRSKSQKKLNREERATNLKGRILCVKEPPPLAILFDDVITTGATINACAAALLASGCKKVYGVCLFFD